ncbi:MAG: bifunctional phosphopantothenoylcysteine decarboxylase/phosphopantothenate--cysteine ligase CoaBC [Victivallaceae bacterium]|nr:bifunctional phosphopantothenoylcysteine decarboxylase/phosphopantothenate--cysteine ligase CoaBC [Victivallaceae bacterium]
MKVLITAGPTREKIDIVRFLSNRSSGKMGYALAAAAAERGWQVVLVSGPVNLSAPAGVRLLNVESAAEMASAVKAEAADADLVIMAAAVADFTPKQCCEHKIKKTSGGLTLELEATEDILLSLGRNKPAGQILVGFAAESENLLVNARDKMRRKNLDWIAANDISKTDSGFAADANTVTLLSCDGGIIELARDSKKNIAEKIIGILEQTV